MEIPVQIDDKGEPEKWGTDQLANISLAKAWLKPDDLQPKPCK